MGHCHHTIQTHQTLPTPFLLVVVVGLLCPSPVKSLGKIRQVGSVTQ